MSNAASVLPAGPGERDDEIFPFKDRLRLRDNFGFVTRRIRKRSAFGALAKGPWSVFIAIATHFQLHVEAWPSQHAIALFSGSSTRAVRNHVAVLECAGVFVLRRERRADGSERIFYQPGPTMRRELAAVDDEFPKDRAKRIPRRPHVIPLHPPTETIAGAPAETVAMEPKDLNQIKPSSSESASSAHRPDASATSQDEEENFVVTKEDREIARWALAERIKQKHPKQPPPRWFDRADVEMVARCTATVEGDRQAKELAHREAIAGAFCTSEEGPPTSRFIWEKQEHFLDHIERGRKKLRNDAIEAQRRQPPPSISDEDAHALWLTVLENAPEYAKRNPMSRASLVKIRREYEEMATTASPEFREMLDVWIAQCRKQEAESSDPISREQMAADLEKLFGPGWNARVPR
jgi:hypothetical protein